MSDDHDNDGGGGGSSLISLLLIVGSLVLVARRWGAACAALGALAFVVFDIGFFVWITASPRDASGGALFFTLAVILSIFPLWAAIHCGRAYRRRAVERAAWGAEAHRAWWHGRPMPEPPAWMKREHGEWAAGMREWQEHYGAEQPPEPQRQPEPARWHPQPPPDPWLDTLPAWSPRQPEQQPQRLATGFRSRPFA